jgi:hypothetical protein
LFIGPQHELFLCTHIESGEGKAVKVLFHGSNEKVCVLLLCNCYVGRRSKGCEYRDGNEEGVGITIHIKVLCVDCLLCVIIYIFMFLYDRYQEVFEKDENTFVVMKYMNDGFFGC